MPAQPAQHGDGPLAVGLHGEAEARPAGERGIDEGRGEQAERQIEAVLLLRVDGEAQAVPARRRGEFDEARQQFARQPLLLAGIEARMDGRELDRDAGPRHQLARSSVRRARGAALPTASMALM